MQEVDLFTLGFEMAFDRIFATRILRTEATFDFVFQRVMALAGTLLKQISLKGRTGTSLQC